ncbi:alkylation response protein AidB-like acyl-CoA dehydrogenase [Antricoccus suffuscus]|uniref:Alkylation response protein AidB-like acyl-CoA dehydrogenase n=1 Tax=Antricoccus suffuscus TaxID=1629062 RepID=A0A2T0ZY06_9ACTN|nr:acyl-CoA dehydrogenase family protein [Antricoccus suffuscus]PRZ41235.1 alkylation response protein AidB-like acyl-CoA dehydrogenase [Antricoccus suffuscus]
MPADEFRTKALTWLTEHARPFAGESADGNFAPSLKESKAFQKSLWEAGLAGITWPKEYGGQGLGEDEVIAFNEVASDFLLPTGPFVIGLGMPGPTILELGTEEQKKRHIPPMLSGDEIWCQLFSEPNGGSDVASLQTSAVRTEMGWLINGQKVWTSGAQFSDFGAILVRTDPTVPRHSGITMFIVDMHHPGVTVRPLVVATGDAPFNEVYFDDVEVPLDAVIGEVNQGWAAAVVMLRNERVTIGAGGRSRSNPLGYDALREIAADIGTADDTGVRRRLANLYARETAVAAFGRVLHEGALAGNPIGARGSAAKLAGAELGLWASDAAEDIVGQDIALLTGKSAKAARMILRAPGSATAGGSNEIQRNIVAERVLGLPKDPGAADRKTPFNQLKLSK